MSIYLQLTFTHENVWCLLRLWSANGKADWYKLSLSLFSVPCLVADMNIVGLLQCSGPRLISWGSMEGEQTKERIGAVDIKPLPWEDAKGYHYFEELDGWWILSRGNLKEAGYNRVLHWRRAGDWSLGWRPGSSLWCRSLLLWYKNRPISRPCRKGARSVDLRGQGPSMSSEPLGRASSRYRRFEDGNIRGKGPWLRPPTSVSRRR